MKSYFLWLELVASLATAITNKNGDAPKEKRYLAMLAVGAREGTLTEEKVSEMAERIKNEKLNNIVPSDDDLTALEHRLLEHSGLIQGTKEPT